MDLSRQQADALDRIEQWAADPTAPQVFRLFGYAGTGKTTIARRIPHLLGLRCAYAAYTGKAASVLQSKGCSPATTIHGLIYIPYDKAATELRQARKLLACCTDQAQRVALEILVRKLEQELDQPGFVLDPRALDDLDLLIIDEVSMIDDELGCDLLSFGVRLLVLGDPAQLPPVDAGSQGAELRDGYFMRQQADYLLTEVHRQQEGSPVLELATRIRSGAGLAYSDYATGTAPAVGAANPDAVILVGTNKTRWALNNLVRDRLGRQPGRPEVGDQIVCLHNNRDLGLFNGQLFTVAEVTVLPGRSMQVGLWLVDELGDEHFVPSVLDGFIDAEYEREGKKAARWRRDVGLFTWGYALTVHKAQGSQWDFVYLVDESWMCRKTGEAQRWLYTGVTRAARAVIVGSLHGLV